MLWYESNSFEIRSEIRIIVPTIAKDATMLIEAVVVVTTAVVVVVVTIVPRAPPGLGGSHR